MRAPKSSASSPARRRRKAASSPQLGLWTSALPSAPDLEPTAPLLRNPSCRRVLETTRHVRTFFPELDGYTLKVGLTKAAAGFASREEMYLWFNPHRLSLHTIAHELTHLLQNLGHVPRGEKSADLFALARHRTLVDDLPCYLVVPRSLRRQWSAQRPQIESILHRAARDAVARRTEGHRQYLRWFEEEVAARWDEHVRSQSDASTGVRSVQQAIRLISGSLR
jgi:hypothetical protein